MQKWGIAAGGLVSAGLALSVSIAAAAELKSLDLRDDRVEISILMGGRLECATSDFATLILAHYATLNRSW